MLDLLLAAGLAGGTLVGDMLHQPPRGDDFIICPGDPRCRNRPPGTYPVEPPVYYTSCPDGSRPVDGASCPAPPAAAGPYMVYFGWDDPSLSAPARETLDLVADAFRRSGSSQMIVSGHTDRSGSATYAVGLSQRYANAVRDYLLARGVPPSAITVEAFGESRPIVETSDGIREPLNRRVEITFGPPSAW